MTDREFDEKIKEKCYGMQEMPDSGSWKCIEAELSARHRLVLWRRVGMAVAAAAVIVLFLAWPSEDHQNNADIALEEHAAVQLTEVVEEDAAQPEESPLVSPPSPRPSIGKNTNMDQVVSDMHETVSSGEHSQVMPEDTTSDFAQSVIPASPRSEDNEPSGNVSEEYTVSDYLAFQEDETQVDRRVSISASTDFYTIYGSGNVNFSTKSMSAGGVSASGAPAVKPLSGETPHHDLPLTAGLSVEYGFGSKNTYGQHRFGVGLGVNYTFLKSQYQALVTRDYLYKYGEGREQVDVQQYINYVGIPVFFLVNIITTDKLFFYASIGGEAEKGIYLKYRFTDAGGVTSLRTLSISGMQWSANVGLGFEYRFLKFMGVYVDPRLTYFFDCSQPYSIREEQPLQLNVNLGLRFHF